LFIAVAVAFLFICCNNTDMENKSLLIGAWVDTWQDEDSDPQKEQYTFTENEFTYSFTGSTKKEVNYQTTKEPVNRTDKGTYHLDNSTITFFFSEMNGALVDNITASVDYSITQNELKLTVRGNVYTYKRVN